VVVVVRFHVALEAEKRLEVGEGTRVRIRMKMKMWGGE
jgi:hypothetical protein